MAIRTTYYSVAGIGIAIEGDGKYADAFREYFKSEEKVALEEISLRLRIENDPDKVLIPARYYSLSGKIAFNNSYYYVKKKNFVYSVQNLFNREKPVVLKLCYTGKNYLKNLIAAIIGSNNVGVYCNKDRFVDSIMNYEVFLYIFAVLLMRADIKKIFVHCGIAKYMGKAIVLAGTSGCGKTSTLLSLLQRKGYKYIADDFGILGSDGNAYYMQKKMAVYQSDAKYKNPDVIKALKKLPIREFVNWRFFSFMARNPRYRFIPQQLFGENRIAKKGKIDTIIYMSRISQNASASRQIIKKEELCTKIRHASFRELKELSEILNNIRAVGDENIRNAYPAIEELEREYEQVILEILSNTKIGMLEVPLRVNPDDIADMLLQTAE